MITVLIIVLLVGTIYAGQAPGESWCTTVVQHHAHVQEVPAEPAQGSGFPIESPVMHTERRNAAAERHVVLVWDLVGRRFVPVPEEVCLNKGLEHVTQRSTHRSRHEQRANWKSQTRPQCRGAGSLTMKKIAGQYRFVHEVCWIRGTQSLQLGTMDSCGKWHATRIDSPERFGFDGTYAGAKEAAQRFYEGGRE